MPDIDEPADTHAALQFVLGTDFPLEHKKVLIRVLTQSLRDHETALRQQRAVERTDGSWAAEDTAQLEVSLNGKVAKSWQHADEVLMHLAAQLHRQPQAVLAKARELGVGAGVDYVLAKALRAQNPPAR